eukprot:247165_1
MLSQVGEERVWYNSSAKQVLFNMLVGFVRLLVVLPVIHHLFVEMPVAWKYARCEYMVAKVAYETGAVESCNELNMSFHMLVFNGCRILIEMFVCVLLVYDSVSGGSGLVGFQKFEQRMKLARLAHIYGMDGYWG